MGVVGRLGQEEKAHPGCARPCLADAVPTGTSRGGRLPHRRMVGGAAVLLGLALAGCGSSAGSSTQHSGQTAAAQAPAVSASPAAPASPAVVRVEPTMSQGAWVDVAPVHVAVTGGTLSSVRVTTSGGEAVPGSLEGVDSWQEARALPSDTAYVITATAMNGQGRPTTVSRTVRTLASAHLADVTVTPSNSAEVGDAQPVAISFPVPVTDRAAVMKQLTVTDTDHVPGAWRWLNAERVDYRPETFWPVGDTVTLDAALKGVQLSAGTWGSGDDQSSFHVDSDLHADVDEATHTMTVTDGGRVIRVMPAGTGMPGFRTWTGSMVVLEKMAETTMTSCSVGLGCVPGGPTYYNLPVYDDVRLTPSGTFVHAAPWDGTIGYQNSSHGCIHLTSSDAAWFEQVVQEGDLVTVDGPGAQVALDNGEGDWNLTWQQWTS